MNYDDDINELNISDLEKNGLQVYRNYKNSFYEHEIKLFIEDCDSKNYENLEDLKQVLHLIVLEDIKYLPIILCSFANECLEKLLKRIISEGVPGGSKSILDGFGSLSSFSNRIQMAYIFNILSKDILLELNSFRKIRNDFAHQWNLEKNKIKLKTIINSRSIKIEKILLESGKISDSLDEDDQWKCYLLFFVGRIYYETELYYSCVQKGLNPDAVLYSGKNTPKLFKEVTKLIHQFIEKYTN